MVSAVTRTGVDVSLDAGAQFRSERRLWRLHRPAIEQSCASPSCAASAFSAPSTSAGPIPASPLSRGETRVVFPDRFPIGVHSKTQELTFVYIDEQAPSSYLKAHVRSCLPLWRSLDQSRRFVFVTTSALKKASVEGLFRRFLIQPLREVDERLLDYFRIEHAVGAQNWKAASRADPPTRVRLEKIDETTKHRALYRDWYDGNLPQGVPASAPTISPEFAADSPPNFRERSPFA